MSEYLNLLNKNIHDNFTEELRKESLQNGVPIMEMDGIANLLLIISLTKSNNILEIGSAVGYSSIMMGKLPSVRRIDTIERDEKMAHLARMNIKKAGLDCKIFLHESDALELDLQELLPSYDLILIDAAKAQYQKFFERYTVLLKKQGIVVTDNILFHGCVENQENLSKNVLHMVQKIDKYNYYLKNLTDFQSYFLPVGDGQAISIKKG